ncbi:MAG: PTS sugar transporter subunit IIA [Desulfobacterales bacterium]|jgi:PTS system nitrogen regulatory IIA component|nr:PTS sugar transporter subunit IIA [Desulfobacterales bacterium]
MKILDYLHKETIITDLKSSNKKGVLEELALPVSVITNSDANEVVRVLLERESLGSTGIGGGIGIPHGKMRGLKTLVMGVGLSLNGVDFDAMDNKPTHIFFLILTSEDSAGLHLVILARISKILKEDAFKQKIMTAKNADDVIRIIEEVDEDF